MTNFHFHETSFPQIDAEENFRYEHLTEVYARHADNHPEVADKFKTIIEACKGLQGAIAVKECVEANGGTIF